MFAIYNKFIYHIPAYKNKVVEKTGAGDAFGSSFIAGLIYFNDIKKALELGNANSLSVISKFGAQDGLLNLNKVERLIKKYSNKFKIKEYKLKD